MTCLYILLLKKKKFKPHEQQIIGFESYCGHFEMVSNREEVIVKIYILTVLYMPAMHWEIGRH